MIINLGTNVKKLKTGVIENAICPNCNSKNELIYSIYGGYVNFLGFSKIFVVNFKKKWNFLNL